MIQISSERLILLCAAVGIFAFSVGALLALADCRHRNQFLPRASSALRLVNSTLIK